MTSTEKIEILEKQFKSMVENMNVTPTEFFTALHNAAAYGQLFPSAFYGENDIYLKELFKNLDKMCEISEKM